MNISITPKEQVRLKDLDDVQFLQRAAENASYIFLLEGDARRGRFADEERAMLVRRYVRENPGIRQSIMMAGEAIVREALERRNTYVVGTIDTLYGRNLMQYLLGWHNSHKLKTPDIDAPVTLVRVPGFGPEGGIEP